jgi:hypothetical protein
MRCYIGSHASTDVVVVVVSMLMAFWLSNADADVAQRGIVNVVAHPRIALLMSMSRGGSDDPYAYDAANDPMSGTGFEMEHIPQPVDQQPFQDRIDAWKRYQQVRPCDVI